VIVEEVNFFTAWRIAPSPGRGPGDKEAQPLSLPGHRRHEPVGGGPESLHARPAGGDTRSDARPAGREGARLDAVYFCPHHPGTGALGANREFEVECDCRKPKTGMIERAKRDFSIDLAHSFMIGDTPADIQCGRNAGLGTIAVRTGHPWPASVEAPDRFCEDLAEAVELILKGPPP